MVKVNMMAGKRFFGPDWIHIDKSRFDHIKSNDTYLDTQFDNSIDLIYCSHGIAYWLPEALKELITNWKNKLRPGGILRLATPDFDILSKMYQVGVPLDKLKGPLLGIMNIDNRETICHVSVWDEASLTKLLTDVGFINVRRYDHTKTEHPNTGNREDQYDDCAASYINGTLISLNLEANKPV